MHQTPSSQAEPHAQADRHLTSSSITLGRRTIVARSANGQPRTYRLVRPAPREAAYRRLALTILGLDVKTLALELAGARHSIGGTTIRQLVGADRAA